MGRKKEPMESDHIFPKAERGSDEPHNRRQVPRSENRKKGARMPTLDEIALSPNPMILVHEMEKAAPWAKGYKSPRNKGRGFMGLPRRGA